MKTLVKNKYYAGGRGLVICIILIAFSVFAMRGEADEADEAEEGIEIRLEDRGEWIEIIKTKGEQMRASSTIRKERIAHLFVEDLSSVSGDGEGQFYVRIILSDVDGGGNGKRNYVSHEMGGRAAANRFLNKWRETL